MLVLGATSLVGSHFVERSGFPVVAAGRARPVQDRGRVEAFRPVDLTSPAEVEALVRTSPERTVVNFAARTDVDGIEAGRESGPGAESGAWSVNALAPQAIARAAVELGKRFIHLSTDFVFDGTAGPYAEEAPRSPLSDRLSWYGWTKSEGERLAGLADPSVAIVRISYPYRPSFPAKLDFARWMMAKRAEGTLPPLYGDQLITPTWIPDVTRTVAALVDRPDAGVFHVASPELTTPWEFGTELLGELEPSKPALPRSDLATAPRSPARAPRPLRGGLQVRRALALGVRLTSWREGIRRLARGEEGP